MVAEVTALIELEKVLREIARLRAEIAELPRRVAAIEAKLAGAKQKVEAATASIKKQESERKKSESEIQDWQQKIVKFREQSSAVKTNEQYKALMHEIEFAQQQIGGCEEKILISMEATDELKKSLAAAQAELKADEKEVDEEKEHARSVTAEDEKALASAETQQKSLRTGIREATLSQFERIFAKRGSAMAEAVGQRCTACQVLLRPQRYQDLLAGNELVTCDACNRILYVDPAKMAAEAKSAPKAEKGWFFVPDGNGSGRFIAFINSKSGTAVRIYDATTGALIERNALKKATFQESFPQIVKDGMAVSAPSHMVDESADTLSLELLEELQLQAQIAPTAQ